MEASKRDEIDELLDNKIAKLKISLASCAARNSQLLDSAEMQIIEKEAVEFLTKEAAYLKSFIKSGDYVPETITAMRNRFENFFLKIVGNLDDCVL